MGADAAAWLAGHGEALVGRPLDAARAAVADAGLRPRTLRPGAIVTLEHRPDRVDLQVDEADVVVATSAG